MGWWVISQQAGTAIARHPAFGDFPHEGYLDELWFRLAGHAVRATDEGLHHVEPLMVGRGSAGYVLHVFQARAGHGKLLASGLKLLTAEPEAESLLDQFIRYARSPQFQPQGELDVSACRRSLGPGASLNGWSQTLHAAETWNYASFQGEAPMAIARQTDGASKAAWKTKPVPNTLDLTEPYTFNWVAGLGYVTEPTGQFTLFLGEVPLLDFNVSHKDALWRSADGKAALKYTREVCQ